MGIEPTPSAWKAEVLPLNYTRRPSRRPNKRQKDHGVFSRDTDPKNPRQVVEGEGFEPSKAEPTDLQSAPFDRSGTPPKSSRAFC